MPPACDPSASSMPIAHQQCILGHAYNNSTLIGNHMLEVGPTDRKWTKRQQSHCWCHFRSNIKLLLARAYYYVMQYPAAISEI